MEQLYVWRVKPIFSTAMQIEVKITRKQLLSVTAAKHKCIFHKFQPEKRKKKHDTHKKNSHGDKAAVRNAIIPIWRNYMYVLINTRHFQAQLLI